MATLRIDSNRISDEALRLLHEGGLEAVSFRRIAAALGVGASSLYWHVRDKDALLSTLSQRIFRECLDAVGEQANWRDWLRAFGMALWDAQVTIPDIRKLIVLLRPDTERQRASSSQVVATLQRLGMDEALAMNAQRSVQALVTGWTTLAADGPLMTGQERDAFSEALDTLIDGWRDRQAQLPGG